jgi:hypothetical protein
MSLRAAHIPDVTDFRPVSPDEFEAEPLRVAYAYWRSIRGNRRFPSRADIHPRDIAGLLRHVSLIKYEDGDFIYRIVGDAIVRAYDLSLHNRKLSELVYDEPGFGCIIRPLLERCVETGDIVAVKGHTGRDLVRVNFTDYENILLPLGPNDSTVDHIMAVSNYVSRPYI